MSKDAAPPPDRHARRRLATRTKLIDAARQRFAAQGLESTSINEITDLADVGFGSFYNHFKSKEAIVEAVLSETVAAQALRIHELTAALEDPAEVVAVAHRSFIELARSDPDWAWLLIRLDISHDIAFRALGPHAMRDLQAGIERGRFTVADAGAALIGTGGALLAMMRGVLDGRLPPTAAQLHAEGVLRMFGLSPQDAAEVAARPLPAG